MKAVFEKSLTIKLSPSLETPSSESSEELEDDLV